MLKITIFPSHASIYLLKLILLSPVAEFVYNLVTIPWTGPPSLTDFGGLTTAQK